VEMSGVVLAVLDAGTIGAVDVFGGGGKVPGSVDRDEPGAAHRAHGLQQTRLRKGLVQVIKETKKVARLDRVERLADVIVGGDALHLEKRSGVVPARGFFHVLLKAQEGGTLGEEYREGGQGNVRHGEAAILTRAPIGQTGGDDTQASDDVIEGARIHAPINGSTAPKVQVTIVSQCGEKCVNTKVPAPRTHDSLPPHL
jgi:hypothetical protein